MNITLTINPRFESVIPPMTTAELVLLEENILTDGRVIMPIVVWNDTIIDGHKRFKIVGKHPEIEYSITEMFFEDEFEAVAWICKNQLGRRNLPEEYKKYLIGKRYNMAQAELASRTNKHKKSEYGTTEQGKYSGKYALTDVLVCGCCGSHYRRTGKNVKGEVQHVWRCIGRIEHRCKDAVGLEEKKLHAAICRCLSDMMDSREEVINLCRTNLQYALTGDTKVLDAYAIENQIRIHQDEIDVLMEQEENTLGDPEQYEKEIVALYEKIGILREQLRLAKEQAAASESVQTEIERFMKTLQEYSGDSFTEYDDIVVRRLVECIKVMPDRTIEVILKGGMHGKEKV